MKKTPATETKLDDDFLDILSSNMGDTSSSDDFTIEEPVVVKKTSAVQKTIVENRIEADDEFSKEFKSTQIVIRASEREKREIQAYFMKHGLSISKGIKIAIRYLQKQEKENAINLTEVGIM